MATEAAWLNGSRLTEKKKAKYALTSTGLLMEGLEGRRRGDSNVISTFWFVNVIHKHIAPRHRNYRQYHPQERRGDAFRWRPPQRTLCPESIRDNNEPQDLVEYLEQYDPKHLRRTNNA